MVVISMCGDLRTQTEVRHFSMDPEMKGVEEEESRSMCELWHCTCGL